jgi:hypothetical protein
MAKIKLSAGGFSLIPEGEHVFKIVSASYDEDFGKLEVGMVTASGQKHNNKFNLINNSGEINEPALNAFTFFARTALNNFNLDEIDHEDLIGCYIKCTVEHDIQPSRTDPAKTVAFVRLTDKAPASGFESAAAPAKKGAINLDALLG